MSQKVYEIITEQITKRLESGVCPWKMPWASQATSAPRNAKTKKTYQGCNFFLLSMLGFADPTYVTLKQANDLGGTIKAGEKGFPVIFWKLLEEVKDGKKRMIPMLRYSTVFNISQTEGCKYEAPVTPEAPAFTGIPAAEKIVEGYNGPTVEHGGNRACYMAKSDLVTVPHKAAFTTEEEYFSTLFHELGHSTGHTSRLDRKEVGSSTFGSEPYSNEELVAELTSAFLCATAGIDSVVIDNQAAYIKGWLRKLKEDPKAFVSAAGKAQKAANFIQGIVKEYEKTQDAA
jgi:antirestriction protein ArdC